MLVSRNQNAQAILIHQYPRCNSARRDRQTANRNRSIKLLPNWTALFTVRRREHTRRLQERRTVYLSTGSCVCICSWKWAISKYSRKSVCVNNRFSVVGQFVPQCDPFGGFLRKQYWGSTGLAFCFDAAGNQISTAARPYQPLYCYWHLTCTYGSNNTQFVYKVTRCTLCCTDTLQL